MVANMGVSRGVFLAKWGVSGIHMRITLHWEGVQG